MQNKMDKDKVDFLVDVFTRDLDKYNNGININNKDECFCDAGILVEIFNEFQEEDESAIIIDKKWFDKVNKARIFLGCIEHSISKKTKYYEKAQRLYKDILDGKNGSDAYYLAQKIDKKGLKAVLDLE